MQAGDTHGRSARRSDLSQGTRNTPNRGRRRPRGEVPSGRSLDHPERRSRGHNYRRRGILRARSARSVSRQRFARAGTCGCAAAHNDPAERCVSSTTRAQPRLGRGLRLPPSLTVTLRPVGPSDAGVLQAYVRGLSPQARYDRFFGGLSELSPAELDRVIHLDQKHDLAQLVETWVDGAPTAIGEMRFALATNRLEGEFALSIANDWRGKGLGGLLIADIE